MSGHPVPSPCTNVCRIDRRSGLCEGCRRTTEEIMAWPTATDAAKRQILSELPARSITKRLLPW